MYPWELNQWAMVSTQQKVLTSLNSAPKSTVQLPMAAVGACCQPGDSARLQGVPCSQPVQDSSTEPGLGKALPLPGQRNSSPYCQSSSRRWAAWGVPGSLRLNTGVQRSHWSCTLPSLNRLHMQTAGMAGRIPCALSTSLNTLTAGTGAMVLSSYLEQWVQLSRVKAGYALHQNWVHKEKGWVIAIGDTFQREQQVQYGAYTNFLRRSAVFLGSGFKMWSESALCLIIQPLDY